MADSGLGPTDLARAAAHGLGETELRRQLDLLIEPPASIVLDRPCTLHDGVEHLDDAAIPALLEAHSAAVAAGRATYFVPASGAATRMFKSLLAVRERGGADRARLVRATEDADAAATLRFLDGIERFAFAGDLAEAMRRRGDEMSSCLERGAVVPVLEALLAADGLAYADLPKGLLAFHRYPDRARTAFDEHLVEATAVAASAAGSTRLHFTVSPAHEAAFAERLESSRGDLEPALGTRFSVGFSAQKSSTDTIAIDLEGRPFRDEAGRLLFRPGGHGSLISNLADLAADGADLIFVKNIDNVVHDDWRPPVVHWRRVLAGRLVVLQERLFDALRSLDTGSDLPTAIERGAALLRDELGVTLPGPPREGLEQAAAELRRRLHRPVRVCAVLRAQGDPGGGPFWVREADGSVSPQIVETAQIDQTSAEQRALQAAATHFSPADMVLGVRDYRGEPFDLRRHVDPQAVFIAEKSSGGRALLALEHPGLWNGGMSDWNTLFVEVPPAIFQPVKTLGDLLGPAHQPAPRKREHSP